MRTRQPAGVGKLLEIDLGPDTALENIARTEAAKRRLETGESETVAMKPARKPRLGRDGKPWRTRKGRNEDDIKRDELVEAVMRESKRKSQTCAVSNFSTDTHTFSGYLRCS
jgi:hypothetical protein